MKWGKAMNKISNWVRTSSRGISLFGRVSILALTASGCATIEEVPESPRLTLLKADPVDYARFPERRLEDRSAAAGRGLAGDSVAVQDRVKNEHYYKDEKVSTDLRNRLNQVLPQSDFVYRMKDQTLSEYPIETKFHLYQSDTPQAWALNTGDLLFSSLLLDNVYTEDELDWIIAHEASHQLLDHHRSTENREARAQAISILGAVAMLATGDSKAGNIALGATGAALVLNQAGVAQFMVKEEIQADQLAMDLLLQRNEAARNPNEGLAHLQKKVEAQTAVVASITQEIDKVEQQYLNYCGQPGLFNFKTQLENPNAQTQQCKRWYAVGRQGLEQAQNFQLPQAKQRLADYQQRLTASQNYIQAVLPKTPGYSGLPTSVSFGVDRQNKAISYAVSIDAFGPTVRNARIPQINQLLRDGRCREAITQARGLIRSASDAEGSVREVNFNAEVRCPAEAKPPIVRKKECDPDRRVDYGPYEHLCIARTAGQANLKMLENIQRKYETNERYDLAVAVMRDRREKDTAISREAWYPEEIRLLRLAKNTPQMESVLSACELTEESEDFKQQCRDAAYPPPPPPSSPSPSPVGENGPAILSDAGLSANPSDAAPPDILTLVGSDLPTTYDVFEQALLTTELNDLVQGLGNFTVYVPSDGALARYIGEDDPTVLLEPRNRSLLRKIVSAHIVRTNESGEQIANSPHVKAGLSQGSNVERLLQEHGGFIHTEVSYGPYTVKTVDRVFDFGQE